MTYGKARTIAVEHKLEYYDGFTLKKFIEDLRKNNVPDDAIFQSDTYGHFDGCQFEFKRLETEKEIKYREEAEERREQREREQFERLKIKYEDT